MNSFGTSNHLNKNVLFDGGDVAGTYTKPYEFCVFSSKHIIELIKCIPQEERQYMTDATVQIRPIGPFKELLVIYVVHDKKVD